MNYTVSVNVTGHTDSNFAAAGSISVTNPAPIAATLNSVSDLVSGGIAGTVDCGVTFPYTLAAGGTLTYSYTAAFPDASSRTNTATVTLQNESYTSDGTATAGGTTDFAGQAAIDFSTATITEVDKCITVSDSLQGTLGTACLGIASGASGSAVASTITAADAFLATHNAGDWSSLTKAQQAQVLSWATTLDGFNNGLIDPGYCSQ